MTRVILEIDEAKLSRANEAAAAQNRTIEQMLERFIDVLAATPLKPEDLPPTTRSALGIAKGLPDRPERELLEEALEEKYGPLK